MVTGRKICLALSIGVIVLWVLLWLPAQLPQPIHEFMYVFRSMLNVLLLPAVVGIWLCPENRSTSNKVAGMIACALVSLVSFATIATLCAWGCNGDALVYTTASVFFVAVLGTIYFMARLARMLLGEPRNT
jgi:hypothetical protein